MSDEVAIRTEGLSKRYSLGASKQSYYTLRETLVELARSPARLFGRPTRPTNDLWALDGVDLEIQRGEVVGVIGRNGAGKSTLLKILSRVTEPTRGYAEIRGKVGSLLEVGTGFHPELSGRDNVFLYGSILGMKRAEIERKFDEIVAFADVEAFLDTPVKRYSSGMHMRLAFAVAAHLEPEILIVDEVLAVGDAAFQRKCLRKMQDVSTGGRTVLFVSHNLAAVANLCTSAVVLDKGKVAYRGDVRGGVAHYARASAENPPGGDLTSLPRSGSGGVRFTQMKILDDGEEVADHRCGARLELAFRYEIESELVAPELSILVRFMDEQGATIVCLWNKMLPDASVTFPRAGWAVYDVDRFPLRPGSYRVSIWAKSHRGIEDWLDGCIVLQVIEGDFFRSGVLPPKDIGPVFVDHRFRVAEEISP